MAKFFVSDAGDLFFKYYIMEHRGGLDESLKTRVQITQQDFRMFTMKYDYDFYCFDERINCLRFCKKKIDDGVDNPTWLLIEVIFNG